MVKKHKDKRIKECKCFVPESLRDEFYLKVCSEGYTIQRVLQTLIYYYTKGKLEIKKG